MTHDLKSWPRFFEPISDGRKTFEIRRNDRGYEVGDRLLLLEFEPAASRYTGRELEVEVTYLTNHEQHEGFVVMAIRRAYGTAPA